MWLRSRRGIAAIGGSVALLGLTLAGGLMLADHGDDGDAAEAPAPAPSPPASARAPTTTGAEPRPASGPVAGWIVDDTGAPISRARVSLDGGAAVTTEADGSFRLPADAAAAAGQHTLAIDGDGVHPSQVTWRSDAPAAHILVARRIEVTARVVRGGQPAGGIAVALRDGSGPERATAVSDAAGLVRFADLPQGRYELSAHGPGESSRLVPVASAGGAPTEIALAPATDVRGHVRADDGAPVRATVTLVPMAGDVAVRFAETDLAGAFAIDGVPAGRWDVAVEAPGHVAAARYVLEAAGARSDLELRMRRGGSVAGLVVDPSGSPVAGATLVLRRQGEGGPIAAAATAPAVSAPGRIRWVHPLAGPRQMPLRDSRRFGAPRDGTRPAECGRGHCGVDLGGVRGSTVHAAADGIAVAVVTEIRPRAGRFVMLEHGGGLRTFYMHLDEVRGDLIPGQVVRAGEPIGTLGRSGVIKSGPHLHFALAQEDHGRTWYMDPEPMLQQAIVLAEAAEAAGGALAGAVLAQPRDGTAAAAGPGAALAPSLMLTDGSGRFRIDGLAPGRYVATAFHTGLAPGASDPFEVASAAATGGVEIELSPGVIVVGRVLGPRGPVAGARITAEEGLGESVHSVGKAYTDAAGRFELRPLAGAIDLTVAATGFGGAERHLELVARGMGSARREEIFELAAQDSAIAGQVVDAMGFPVRGASVRIAEGPVRGRRAVSDEGGRFLIPALPAGRYQIEVASADHPTAQVDAGTDDAVRVALAAGGTIRIAVVDRQTRGGVAGARLEATGPGRARARAVADPGGRAELRALATGRWRVRAVAPGFAAAVRTVDLAARGQDATIELSRGAALAGVVRDRNGERVAGARVSVGDAETTTDQNGAFRLADVPSGRVIIECESEGRRGEQSLDLAPGDEIVTLELRL